MFKNDYSSIPLLLITLIGALKGKDLPYLIPQILAIISLALLLYRGIFIKSKYAILYTTSLWLSLTWIMGIYANIEYSGNILMKIPFYVMLLFTTIVAFVHQRIHRRLNPVTVRGLEIEPNVSPFSQWLKDLKAKFSKQQEQQERIKLITFDLGEEVQHKSR